MFQWIKKTILNSFISYFVLLSSAIIANEPTYVTCMLWGEIGNQMFEIANVVAYALDHQCKPVFSDFANAAAGKTNLRYVFHRLNILEPNYGIYFEDYHHSVYNPQYAPIPYEPGKNLRLLGHYQNERYFSHHSEYIKQLFAPSEEILQYIRNKYGKLEDLFNRPTVAVHVRTFITAARNPELVGFSGATWDYFINAINYFPEHYKILVFSDCPEWTKNNFPIERDNITFITGNPHYIDLYFMSLCHHQVISPESTFSWWAAWLNSNPNKIVIAPHYWQIGYTADDAFPSDWIRIYAKQLEPGAKLPILGRKNKLLSEPENTPPTPPATSSNPHEVIKKRRCKEAGKQRRYR